MFMKYAALGLLFSASLGATGAYAAPAGEEDVAKGRHLFEARCMHCHGEKGDGKGHLINFLKLTPANLTILQRGSGNNCITDRVLKAVLGRHAAGDETVKMPLLKDALNPEEVYFIAEYVKSIQQ